MHTPDPPPPDEPAAEPPGGRAFEGRQPPDAAPPPREIVLPRGCNPLTFGVVMATLEMALFLGLWQRCH